MTTTSTVKHKKNKKNKKAIAVAQDVLNQLKYKNYKPVVNYYFNAEKIDVSNLSLENKDVCDLLPKLCKKCEVCALGACLLSTARLYDNMPADEVFMINRDYNWTTNSYKDPYLTLRRSDEETFADLLSDVFDENQCSLIESAFERTCRGNYEDHEEVCRAIEFGEKYDDDKKRMRAIMRNVIRNDGWFTV